jgi:membrane protease YdiL (CAAX protease family)
MLQNTTLNSIVHLALLLPLFIIAWRRAKNKSFTPLIWFGIIYMISNLLQTMLSDVVLFEGQQYNWVGKGAALLFLVVCCFIIKGYSKKDFGLVSPAWENSKSLLRVCAIYLLIRIGLYVFSSEASAAIHTETFLFQATLPGLQEELLFRGLLLGLLNSFFVSNWTVIKVKFGWAAIITSVLFGLAHAVSYSGSFGIHFEPMLFVRTVFDGFLFALLVQKTRSIVPAAIYHNLLNLISNH